MLCDADIKLMWKYMPLNSNSEYICDNVLLNILCLIKIDEPGLKYDKIELRFI